MNLHDWIDELCDVLDVDTEVDEALLADLAESVGRQVHRTAGPVTAYLLGWAAGVREADPETVERLAGDVSELADGWDQPADATDPDDVDDDVPDDTGVDHTGDAYEED